MAVLTAFRMSRHPDVPTISIAMGGSVSYDPPDANEARFTAQTVVVKRVFTLPEFELESGSVLRNVQIGYETYGHLNAKRDNAILIAHYFTGTSHAAGRYHESDVEPGYWDSIIGPGKAIDTDRFFVIAVDCISNINTGNPMVFTTGPLSINHETGKPYLGDFPLVTIGDFVRSQYALCRYLELPSLFAVAGPSMGSMQALEWAARFPDYVRRVIGVIGGGLHTEPYLIGLLRQWCAPIYLDPKFKNGFYDPLNPPQAGLAAAFELVTLTALSPQWANRAFARRAASSDTPPENHLANMFSVENALAVTAQSRAQIADANSFLRIAKAVQLFDLTPLKDRLKARILWIPAKCDLLLFPEYAERGITSLRELGLEVNTHLLETEGGHLDGLGEIKAASAEISKFLAY
jgi:homoserine O-acetyltransferase